MWTVPFYSRIEELPNFSDNITVVFRRILQYESDLKGY